MSLPIIADAYEYTSDLLSAELAGKLINKGKLQTFFFKVSDTLHQYSTQLFQHFVSSYTCFQVFKMQDK